MTSFIVALVLLALAVLGVVVRKAYYYLPFKELKRQAEHNDALAVKLYQAVAYGTSLRVLLWSFIALTSAAGFVLLARLAPPWLSLAAVALLLWVAFSWLPASKLSPFGARLAVWATPGVVWLLNYVHPLLDRTGVYIERRYAAPRHTRLYERSDLVELLEKQLRQADNRITSEELEIAGRALHFSDYKVRDVLTPRAAVRTVSAEDTVGPILIDELHKAGQEFVLVSDAEKSDILGTLRINDLGIHSSGRVRDHMREQVYYLHENDSLGEALHAFYATNCPLFIAVNSFGEYVGIVTVEAMLHQLLGELPGDDFEQYADRQAVAARPERKQAAAPEEEAAPPATEPPADSPSENEPEVVE